MKTKRIIYFSSIIAFMVLFYHQRIGLNLLIFNLILLSGVTILETTKLKSKEVLITIVGCLITAFASAWYADGFSFFMNIVLLCLLPVFLFDAEKRLVTASLKFAFNCLTSPMNLGNESPFGKEIGQERTFVKFFFWIVLPILVGSIFMVLYSYVNDGFAELIQKIQLPDLEFDFILVLILGFILMIWFWYYKTDLLFAKKEHWFNNGFGLKTITWMENKELTPKIILKRNSGIVLFSILNLMLLLLLFFDFQQLIVQGGIPENKGHSEYVHEGIYAVIFSIVLAILLIMIYLNKRLNFGKINQPIRLLATIWVGLNFFLLISSSIKNWYYIDAFGLTYKRLGVYAFLLLCVIGLIFTSIKILKSRTNYFLIRNMSWTFLLFFVLITPINWSSIITKHNLAKHKENNQVLHYGYLDELPYYNSHLLMEEEEYQNMNKYDTKLKNLKRQYNKRLDWRSSALYLDWLKMKGLLD